AKEAGNIKGIAHITGGGFIENVPRMLPKGITAKLNINTIEEPKVYDVLRKLSGLEVHELYNTFNMGVGMMLVVSQEEVASVVKALQEAGEQAAVIGEIVAGDEGVILCQD
ncbi:MAG: AIR synthase-related protein, partial [Niameybacter sp.]